MSEAPEYTVNTTGNHADPVVPEHTVHTDIAATVDVPDDTEVRAVAEALREIVAKDGIDTDEDISAIEQGAELLEALSA